MKKAIRISQANILYLITMTLVITAGSLLQYFNLSWGLVATEVLLILLPAALILRINGIPLRMGLRLRPIGLGLAAACAVIGIGIFFFDAYIEGLIMQLTGMQPVSISGDMLPSGVIKSAAYFAALAIFAPICEEALFRGVIQGAYERQRSAKFAIIMTSLLFAFYHFRLTGLPALLPIALILGYVGWRTRSLYAVILVHFGNNFVSSVYTLVALNVPNFQMSITNAVSAGAGLLVAVGLLIFVIRKIPAPVTEAAEAGGAEAAVPLAPRPSWIKLYWPLIAAGFLYAAIGGMTLVTTLNPEMTAAQGITFNEAGWKKQVEYHYVITNRAEDEIGEAVCAIAPGTDITLLECSSNTQGYELKTGNSFFSDATHSLKWAARWDSQTLELVAFELERFAEDGELLFTAVLDGSQMNITDSEGQLMTEEMGTDILLGHEWAWRMMFVKGEAGTASKVPFGYLMTWDEKEQRSHPQVREELLRLVALDPITVPAGHFDAWKVTIKNDKTAWYSTGSEMKLLRYDDGMNIYSLVE